MDQRSFGALFGPLFPEELPPALAEGLVENMSMDHTTRRMEAVVRFSAPIAARELFALELTLARTLDISGVGLCPVYPPDTFTDMVCPDLIQHLKKENVAVNGTFEDASFLVDGDVLRVTLSHGGINILKTTGADRQLQQLILRQCDHRV